MNTYPYNPLGSISPYLMNNPIYQQSFQQPVMPGLPAPQMEIPKVTGEESARAFAIGPNSSVILMDTNQPLIWVVVTDSSGYKTVTPFMITPYTPEQPVSASDLKTEIGGIEDRLAKLEERMNNYGQSNSRPAWQSKSGNVGTQSNDRNGSGIKGSNGND